MEKLPVSVTMMVKNGQKYLAHSLKALQDFDEVIILDNNSTDNSAEIALSFPNVTLYKSDFFGFGPMKNQMAEKAKHDWILNIDSDEIFSADLVDEIRQINFEQKNKAYAILRINHYRGKPIKTCGWYPDYVKRLYNKTTANFNDKQVHESLDITNNIELIRLKHSFKHYSFDDASGLINKMQKYTTLFAQQQRFKKNVSVFTAVTHGISAFFKNYFLRRGFMDGNDGFIISTANAMGAYYKYIKLYEANQSLTTTLIITTYNRPDALKLVLDSVLNQKELPDEVVIADDGSKPETIDLIKKYQETFPVPLIHSWQEDKGFRASRSRNLAISHSSMDYIIMIDGDIILDKYFILDHKKVAKRKILVQGGRALLTPEKSDKLLKNEQKGKQLFWYSKGVDTRLEKRLQSMRIPFLRDLIFNIQKAYWHKGIRTANIGCFKEDIIEINGFNNNFIGWGREDSEFAERFFNAGGKRANLKFGGPGYHLWHKEAERDALPENDLLFAKTVNEKLSWCENGLGNLNKKDNE